MKSKIAQMYLDIAREIEDLAHSDEVNTLFVKLLLKKLDALEKRVEAIDGVKPEDSYGEK